MQGNRTFYIENNYVFSISRQLHYQFQQLPFELQNHFDAQYKHQSKNMLIAYILHIWAFGSSYAYRNQWVKQFVFWATLGGLSFWWFYTTCVLWYRIKEENEQLATNLMNQCLAQLQMYGSVKKSRIDKNTKPKELNIEYNPSDLTVNNLAEKFLVDFQTKTWEVKRYWQQDWENATSERFYLLEQAHEQMFLTIKHESFVNSYFCSRLINIHVIDNQLQTMINNHQALKNIIFYQGQQYYKEIQKTGIIFDLGNHEEPKSIIQWDYYTENRDMCISISFISEDKIIAYTGFKINANAFSDILPRNIS